MASWGSGRTGRVAGRPRVSRLQPNDSAMPRGISVRVSVTHMLKARQPPSVLRFRRPGRFRPDDQDSHAVATGAATAIADSDQLGPIA
jgi:hypothetical protein